MKYWFDTEFIERGNKYPIELISIGIVSEDGRELYRICSDGWDPSHASDWVTENVISKLEDKDTGFWKTRNEIVEEILEFVDKSPEFWASCSDYDWVVFCQLFGSMIDLPKNFPMFCMDIQQLRISFGISKEDLPKQDESSEHNALADAKHAMRKYKAIYNIAKRYGLINIV